MKPDQLKIPKPPSFVLYLWGYWQQINRRRSGNGFGPNPLNDDDLDRWGRPRGIRLDLWEREAILAIDDAFIAHTVAEASKRNQSGA